MKIESWIFAGLTATGLMAVNPLIAAPTLNTAGPQAQAVITALPAHGGQAPSLEPSDVTVIEGNTEAPVIGLERLTGSLAGMQLLVLLDDSSKSSSLGVHLAELKKFIAGLPPATEVAIGYMRNGTIPPSTSFTVDHEKAAGELRPPLGLPGINGSPYLALSEIVTHWPSKAAAGRKAILMLTDGVDPYYGSAIEDDPYVDGAIRDAQREGVQVYAIYLRGAGLYGRSDWVTNVAQSRLMQLTEATGGHAYFQDFGNPVTIAPFVEDLETRLANQYRVTVAALHQKGFQPVKFRSEFGGVKIHGPAQIYVP